MNKDQERSFIARITCNGIIMSFAVDRASSLPGNMLTRFEAYDSLTQEMLPIHSKKAKHMVVHFQCYDDYYNLQILSETYYQKYISKDEESVLGAFPAAGGNTTSFNLLDNNHQIITLDDLNTAQATIHLKARNAGIIKKTTWRDPASGTCFTDKSGDIATFRLVILERHAVTPQRSTPYLVGT